MIVGAGELPCTVFAVGALEHHTTGSRVDGTLQGVADWGAYTVDEAALRHGAGVEKETTNADEAYAETLQRFAIEEDGLVNWPPLPGLQLGEGSRDGQIRTQWCHGAPGIVATLADLLGEELAVAGGELTWRAGPLQKGANLCHGTAGNGYAFLALLEHTGDERWLTRARAFAMHAAGQVEHNRSDYGRGRYTLWTGDLGTALYLADCIDGGGKLPLP